MKIANSYEDCKRPRRNYTLKCENCKLIWKLQTDMKISNWYENCKAILTFWCIVPMWMFAISYETKREWKLVLKQKERFHLIAVWMMKTQQNNLLQNLPWFKHILIPIPMWTQSDSYFKPWFLCSPGGVFSGSGCPPLLHAFCNPCCPCACSHGGVGLALCQPAGGGTVGTWFGKGALWAVGAWSRASAVIHCFGKNARWIGSALRTASVMDLRHETENL